MERFIADLNYSAKYILYNLKSSMERFIVCTASNKSTSTSAFKIQYGEIYRKIKMVSRRPVAYLKSSMERFIGGRDNLREIVKINLKSSMERFIALAPLFQ